MPFPRLSFLVGIVVVIASTFAANDPNCGIRGPKPGMLRIVGGRIALPHEFPWQCRLMNMVDKATCGAAILNERWLITAGHCVDGTVGKTSNIEIYCGFHDFGHLEGTETITRSDKVFRHPEYVNVKQDILYNDVALIKLKRSLDLKNVSAHLGSVCIPDEEVDLDRHAGKECIATGWGLTKNPNQSNNILRKVSLKIWKQADCQKQWDKHTLNKANITKGMICFGGGQKSTCAGDSGGPYNCFDRKSGRWFSYGVTSFGHDATCVGPFPVVDARLSTYSKWIWKVIKEHS